MFNSEISEILYICMLYVCKTFFILYVKYYSNSLYIGISNEGE